MLNVDTTKAKEVLSFGEFVATKTFEDAMDDLLVLEKLWAKKTPWIYVLVSGTGKMGVDLGHQRVFAGSIGLDLITRYFFVLTIGTHPSHRSLAFKNWQPYIIYHIALPKYHLSTIISEI